MPCRSLYDRRAAHVISGLHVAEQVRRQAQLRRSVEPDLVPVAGCPHALSLKAPKQYAQVRADRSQKTTSRVGCAEGNSRCPLRVAIARPDRVA